MIASVETLHFHPPFDWEGLLSFFRPRAIPGVEWIEDGALQRSITRSGERAILEIRKSGERELTLTVWGNCGPLRGLASRVLDLDTNPLYVVEHFAEDPILGALVEKWPGIRLPGAWDTFEMGVRAILGQQVSVKAAHTLAGRLVMKFGHDIASPFPAVHKQFPLAAEMAEVPVEEIAAIGLPRKRAETLHHFARWSATQEESRGSLMDLPGIGPWTESYLRMRGNSDRDAFPSGDLGIQKALGIQGLGPLKAAREAEAISLRWKPYRAYAVFLLWRSLA